MAPPEPQVHVPVFRAPIRARDRELTAGRAADDLLARGLVGIGDRLDTEPSTLDEAVAATAHTHGEKAGRMLQRFASIIDGALIWTRGSDGRYSLGRLAGRWRYDDSTAARAVGIHHVRPALWLDRRFDSDETPAAVVATFARGGRNFQRIHDPLTERRTTELWNAHQ